jgi:DNA (cytosine-5)-methyltransferase 1
LSAPWIDWRFQSEIEPFPCAVLKHRFPDAVNLGDMTKFKDWPDATIDVLCGGTPCQSFSVAGLRKGLADPRGNLMLTYLAIAGRYRPRWLVWENVPGVLSSNGGRDFGALIAGLGQLGYGFAYRVLDAQFCRTRDFPRAVPQRRRRVFVVGHLGDWTRAAAVLFDAESLSGNPPPRRESGQGVAPTISARPTGGGGLGTDFDCDGGLIAKEVAPTLNAHFGNKMGLENQHIDGGCGHFVAHALRREGFNASEDGTPTATIAFHPTQDPISSADVCHSISENDNSTAAVALPKGKQDAYAHETDASFKLSALRQRVGEKAFQEWALGGSGRISAPKVLRCDMHGEGLRGATIEAQPVMGDGALSCSEDLPAGALREMWERGPDGCSPQERKLARQLADKPTEALQGMPHSGAPWAVRRLTPIEAERLMGFPDGWTAIPWRSKPADKCPDGPRYKALGNSWAVNCGQYIFDRIKAVEGLTLSDAGEKGQ